MKFHFNNTFSFNELKLFGWPINVWVSNVLEIYIMQRHPNSRDQNIMFAISQLVKYSKRSDSSMFATFVAYQLLCIFDYLFSINFPGLITWYWFCFVMIIWGKIINQKFVHLLFLKNELQTIEFMKVYFIFWFYAC